MELISSLSIYRLTHGFGRKALIINSAKIRIAKAEERLMNNVT